MKQHNKSTTHLLVFIYSMGDGGAERVTASLANYWVIQGRAVTIVTLAPQSTDLFDLHPDVQRISLGLASESAQERPIRRRPEVGGAVIAPRQHPGSRR